MRDWRPNPFTLTMRRRVAALPKIEACPSGKGEQSKIDQGQDKFRYKENDELWEKKRSAHWPGGGVNQHSAGGARRVPASPWIAKSPHFPSWGTNAAYLRLF